MAAASASLPEPPCSFPLNGWKAMISHEFLYEARRNKIPIHPDTISNVQRLANINARIPFVHLLQTTPNNLVNTQLGTFAEGSVCSYQLANMEPGFEEIGSFDATTNITLDKDT